MLKNLGALSSCGNFCAALLSSGKSIHDNFMKHRNEIDQRWCGKINHDLLHPAGYCVTADHCECSQHCGLIGCTSNDMTRGIYFSKGVSSGAEGDVQNLGLSIRRYPGPTVTDTDAQGVVVGIVQPEPVSPVIVQPTPASAST